MKHCCCCKFGDEPPVFRTSNFTVMIHRMLRVFIVIYLIICSSYAFFSIKKTNGKVWTLLRVQTSTTMIDESGTELETGPFLVIPTRRAGPYEWADAFSTITTEPAVKANSFSLITYNVLAPLNGESDKHSYAKESVTKWSRRRDKLIDEIRKMKADVLCLQEVSGKGLKETFIPKLLPYGLECCAYAPAKSADRHRGKFAHRAMGCAVFIRSSKISVLGAKRIHLKDFASLDKSFSHSLVAAVHSRFDAMALLHLQLKATNQSVIVGNAHFYWNPQRPDIKAIQTMAAMEAMRHFANNSGFSLPDDVPMILAGDLNTMPSNQQYSMDSFHEQVASAPFELLGTGVLPSKHPEHPDSYFLQVGGSNPQLGAFNPRYKLKNAYFIPEFEAQRPLFTTKTDDFAGWIDHVWVNERVEVSHVLVPPVRAGDLEANRKARQFVPIPSPAYPSDHLPIGVTATLR